jgi:hypothetical protein
MTLLSSLIRKIPEPFQFQEPTRYGELPSVKLKKRKVDLTGVKVINSETELANLVRFSDDFKLATAITWTLPGGATQRQQTWSQAFMVLSNYYPPSSDILKNVVQTNQFRLEDYRTALRDFTSLLHDQEGTQFPDDDLYFNSVTDEMERNLNQASQAHSFRNAVDLLLKNADTKLGLLPVVTRSAAIVMESMLPVVPPDFVTASLLANLRQKLRSIYMSPPANVRPAIINKAVQLDKPPVFGIPANVPAALPDRFFDDEKERGGELTKEEFDEFKGTPASHVIRLDRMTLEQLKEMIEIVEDMKTVEEYDAFVTKTGMSIDVKKMRPDETRESILNAIAQTKKEIDTNVRTLKETLQQGSVTTPSFNQDMMIADIDDLKSFEVHWASVGVVLSRGCLLTFEVLAKDSAFTVKTKKHLLEKEGITDPKEYITLAVKEYFFIPLTDLETRKLSAYRGAHVASANTHLSLRTLEVDKDLISWCIYWMVISFISDHINEPEDVQFEGLPSLTTITQEAIKINKLGADIEKDPAKKKALIGDIRQAELLELRKAVFSKLKEAVDEKQESLAFDEQVEDTFVLNAHIKYCLVIYGMLFKGVDSVARTVTSAQQVFRERPRLAAQTHEQGFDKYVKSREINSKSAGAKQSTWRKVWAGLFDGVDNTALLTDAPLSEVDELELRVASLPVIPENLLQFLKPNIIMRNYVLLKQELATTYGKLDMDELTLELGQFYLDNIHLFQKTPETEKFAGLVTRHIEEKLQNE